METIVHPAMDPDLAAVAFLVAEIRGAADSGRETLGRLGEPETTFATRPFRSGSVEGEWVAAPGTHGDGVLLYLHGRRFQLDEPAAVYAARLSAATRLPVLHLGYRLAPEHPYPAALDDVIEAYQALLARAPRRARSSWPGTPPVPLWRCRRYWNCVTPAARCPPPPWCCRRSPTSRSAASR
jgi:hypothetical protein